MNMEIEPLEETLPLMPYETGGSITSRLAAMNGAGNARQFCWDQYMDFEKIAAGDVGELTKLATFASVDLTALICWSPKSNGTHGYSIRGETVTNVRSRRTRLRVCVACIDDAMSANPHLPADAAVAVPVYTLLDPIRTCPHHAMSLVQVADSHSFGEHYQDYSIAIADALEDLDSLRSRSIKRPVSEFERYLLGRLGVELRSLEPLLDTMNISQVMTICERFGAFHLHGRNALITQLDEPGQHAAAQAGFEIMVRGEDGLRDFVTNAYQRAAAEGKAGMSSTIFGRLRTFLTSAEHAKDFEPIKQIMVDRLSELVPYGPDDPPIFGVRPSHRHWHTLISAERQYGIPYRTIKKNVERAGIYQRLNLAAFSKTRFAIAVDELERVFGAPDVLIPRLEVTAETGAHAKDFTALEAAGLLVPATGKSHTANAWFRRGDVAQLERTLLARAVPMQGELPGWVTVQRAFLSTSWSRAEVFGHIASGAVPTGSVEGVRSVASLRVDLAALRRLHPLSGREVMSMVAAAAALGVSEQVIERLIKSGRIEAHNLRNEETGKLKTAVFADEVLEFQRTFIPVSEIWLRRGGQMSKINPMLRSRGLKPVFPPDELRCTFYARQEVDSVFPPTASSPASPVPGIAQPL